MVFIAVIGDNEKLEFLYARWKKLMLGKAFGILRDHGLAQDAVSEAFIRVYKNLKKIDDLESGKTAAFLVMIVKNVSLTMLSKQAKAAVVDMNEYDRADPFNMENHVASKIAADDIMKVIGKLNEDLKTPFLLKYAYDYSLKEIGKALKITENSAAVRLHRARAKLADLLKKEGLANES